MLGQYFDQVTPGVSRPRFRREAERRSQSSGPARSISARPWNTGVLRVVVSSGEPSLEWRIQKQRSQEQTAEGSLLHSIRHLLESGEVEKARGALEAIGAETTGQEFLRLRRLLGRPTVRVTAANERDHAADFAWLVQHAGNYHGRWVALANGTLLGEAKTLAALSELIAAAADRPLVIRVD